MFGILCCNYKEKLKKFLHLRDEIKHCRMGYNLENTEFGREMKKWIQESLTNQKKCDDELQLGSTEVQSELSKRP
jgi:hypothetical protein